VGITFIYVTHDQEEALTMSDRIAVMNAGRIAQVGTPQEVYESPADAYVADFLGAANLLKIVVTERVRGGASTLKLGDIALSTSNEVPAEPGPVSAGTVAQAVIRPERVRVEEHGSPGVNRVPALVDRVVYLGAATQVYLRLATGESLQAVASNEEAAGWSQGTPVHVYLPAAALRVLAGDAEPAPADAEAAVAS
jgi:spermidine/putrescine transport system ATP-binding protein